MTLRSAPLLCVLAFSPAARAVAQPASAARPAPPTAALEEIAGRADAARQAGRLDEAATLYRQGLVLRPRWAEGLFYLGTMAYDRDRFPECRDALRRLVAVEPKMGQAWALRGLCEFHLGAYAAAREHLETGLSLPMPPTEDLTRVALYHHALLLVRETKFDLAIAPLSSILQFQAPTGELELACGLVLLRRPLLPQAIPAATVDLVKEAGQAYCASLARHPEVAVPRFEALIAKHPRARHLHYGYGLALAQQGSARAMEQYQREIELFPDDVLARVELGFALLALDRAPEALKPAEAAVSLAPGLFATHLVLGRALVTTGTLERGIRELEVAAALAPQIPEIQLTLARACAQAGRKADAERANARFHALESVRRGAPASGAPSPKAP